MTAFLVVAALVYFGPEAMSHLAGGTKQAWEVVFYGGEAAFLWTVVFAFVPTYTARAVAAWGVLEALQRPVCRLAFPMDHAPDIGTAANLCDAAFGLPMSALSIVAALGLAALAQESGYGRKPAT